MEFLEVEKNNHHELAVQYATDLRTKRDNAKKMRTGTWVVTWCTSFVRNVATLLKPTSFVEELYSQIENSSIEVVREFFIAIQ